MEVYCFSFILLVMRIGIVGVGVCNLHNLNVSLLLSDKVKNEKGNERGGVLSSEGVNALVLCMIFAQAYQFIKMIYALLHYFILTALMDLTSFG